MIRFTCGEKKIGKVSKSLKKLCPWLKLEAKYTAKEESKFIGKKKRFSYLKKCFFFFFFFFFLLLLLLSFWWNKSSTNSIFWQNKVEKTTLFGMNNVYLITPVNITFCQKMPFSLKKAPKI